MSASDRDDTWAPYPDQWAYLAGLPRLQPASVEDLAPGATDKGQVIGVRMGESADEQDATPWLRRPSRRRAKVRVEGPLPAQIHAVLD